MLHRKTCICEHHPEMERRCVAHGMASAVAQKVALRMDAPYIGGNRWIQIKDMERRTAKVSRERALRMGWGTEHIDVFITIYDALMED